MYESKIDYATKSKLHLGVSGSIVRWDKKRGLGFVKTQDVADDIFFKINVLVAANQSEPQKNEEVTVYAKYDDTQKRWQATKVTSPQREQLAARYQAKENQLIRPMKKQLRWAIPAAIVWLLCVCVMLWSLGGSYILISLITLMVYALDKRRALNDSHQRIPENTLHTLALLGGWSGALIARYLFRHKTQKQPFVNVFWLTVIANIIATGYLLFSGSLKNF